MDEGDIEDYKLRPSNLQEEKSYREVADANEVQLQDFLLEQLIYSDFNKKEEEVAKIIIGNIDEIGYLTRSSREIKNDLALFYSIDMSENEVEKIVSEIQSFEPAGIAARNLQECLLIQLNRKNANPAITLAIQIITRAFDFFAKKRYDYIKTRFKLSDQELQSAIDEIVKLNPKPGSFFDNSTHYNRNQSIIPDFIVETNDNDEIVITQNSYNCPNVSITKSFEDMLKSYEKKSAASERDKETHRYLKEKVENGKNFIEAIKIRNSALVLTMSTIVTLQKKVFLTGEFAFLKPMKQQEIAEMLNFDASTISRIVNSKYVSTFFGIFPLKQFFSYSITNNFGEEKSANDVKTLLQKFVEEEDKNNPLRDEDLLDLLHKNGFSLARRTVSKYREALGIAPAWMRKQIKS
jgi:RNA polymerase sigma-54 factor